MSVKLYRHNESGEIVAAVYKENCRGDKEYIRFDGTKILFDSGLVPKKFEEVYTPLPEAPEVGSDDWAFAMVSKGYEVCLPCWPTNKRISLNIGEDYSEITIPIGFDDWQLYAPPKPIVELLPHEFVEGQEVLVRDYECREWMKRIFIEFVGQLKTHPFRVETEIGENGYYCCLPYAGNEHLEGTVTDNENGAVPRGYVPPHVPKLGEDGYWVEGDSVLDLSSYTEYTVHSVDKHRKELRLELNNTGDSFFYHVNGKYMGTSSLGLRLIYHKGSYVREDGTVHEHIPTRPYRIED